MEELEKFYPVMKFAEEPLDQVNPSLVRVIARGDSMISTFRVVRNRKQTKSEDHGISPSHNS